MKKIRKTAKFNRELKKVRETAGADTLCRLDAVIDLLLGDISLPPEYKDHQLKGTWEKTRARECHIRPDLLLVYRNTADALHLLRIGSHSELF